LPYSIVVQFVDPPPTVRWYAQILLVATGKISGFVLTGEICWLLEDADKVLFSARPAVAIANPEAQASAVFSHPPLVGFH
jgi:hypothetical protein